MLKLNTTKRMREVDYRTLKPSSSFNLEDVLVRRDERLYRQLSNTLARLDLTVNAIDSSEETQRKLAKEIAKATREGRRDQAELLRAQQRSIQDIARFKDSESRALIQKVFDRSGLKNEEAAELLESVKRVSESVEAISDRAKVSLGDTVKQFKTLFNDDRLTNSIKRELLRDLARFTTENRAQFNNSDELAATFQEMSRRGKFDEDDKIRINQALVSLAKDTETNTEIRDLLANGSRLTKQQLETLQNLLSKNEKYGRELESLREITANDALDRRERDRALKLAVENVRDRVYETKTLQSLRELNENFDSAILNRRELRESLTKNNLEREATTRGGSVTQGAARNVVSTGLGAAFAAAGLGNTDQALRISDTIGDLIVGAIGARLAMGAGGIGSKIRGAASSAVGAAANAGRGALRLLPRAGAVAAAGAGAYALLRSSPSAAATASDDAARAAAGAAGAAAPASGSMPAARVAPATGIADDAARAAAATTAPAAARAAMAPASGAVDDAARAAAPAARAGGSLASRALGPAVAVGVGAIEYATSDNTNDRRAAVGGAGGAIVGAAIGSFVPIPIVGTVAGGLIGDYVGRRVSGWFNSPQDAIPDNIRAAGPLQETHFINTALLPQMQNGLRDGSVTQSQIDEIVRYRDTDLLRPDRFKTWLDTVLQQNRVPSDSRYAFLTEWMSRPENQSIAERYPTAFSRMEDAVDMLYARGMVESTSGLGLVQAPRVDPGPRRLLRSDLRNAEDQARFDSIMQERTSLMSPENTERALVARLGAEAGGAAFRANQMRLQTLNTDLDTMVQQHGRPVRRGTLAAGGAGAASGTAAVSPGSNAMPQSGASAGVTASRAGANLQIANPPTRTEMGGGGRLGHIAERYESGGRGVGTVSTGVGDAGGVSYGRYQLASNTGTMQTFLDSAEGAPFRERFAGLRPGSPEFTARYREVVANQGSDFDSAQHNFIDRTHYQPVRSRAERLGFDVSNPAIQEALWSQSVQHSGRGNRAILDSVVASGVNMQDTEAVIRQIYSSRNAYASQFASEAATTRRYSREAADVIALQRQHQARLAAGGAPADAAGTPAAGGAVAAAPAAGGAVAAAPAAAVAAPVAAAAAPVAAAAAAAAARPAQTAATGTPASPRSPASNPISSDPLVARIQAGGVNQPSLTGERGNVNSLIGGPGGRSITGERGNVNDLIGGPGGRSITGERGSLAGLTGQTAATGRAAPGSVNTLTGEVTPQRSARGTATSMPAAAPTTQAQSIVDANTVARGAAAAPQVVTAPSAAPARSGGGAPNTAQTRVDDYDVALLNSLILQR